MESELRGVDGVRQQWKKANSIPRGIGEETENIVMSLYNFMEHLLPLQRPSMYLRERHFKANKKQKRKTKMSKT